MTTAGTAAESGRPQEAVRRRGATAAAMIVIGIVVVVGVGLRFASRSPLWLDEALSVNLARLPASDLPDALRRDGHPALYYLLLGSWIDLFGAGDGTVRALSGLASLVTVPVVWAATRIRFGPRIAYLAAVLAATSPFLIRYGSESRMYAQASLLVALGWWAIESARRRPSPAALVAVSVITAAAVHTHYWMSFVAGAAAAVMALEGRAGPPAVRRSRTALLVAMATGAATLVIWAPVLLDQLVHTGTPWADRARPAEIGVETVEALGGGMRFEPVLLGILLVLFAVLGAFAVGARNATVEIATRPPVATLGLVSVIGLTIGGGGLVAIATGGAFEARYAATVVPLVIPLVARGVAQLGGPLGVGVILALAGLGVAVAADDIRRDRTQGEDVANAIDAGAATDDVVAFCPDQLAPATLRYLDHPGSPITYPPTADPRFVDWYDYLDRIDSVDPVEHARELDRAAGDSTVWLVMMTSYRGFGPSCETLAASLGSTRPQQTVVLGSTAFEPMFLHRFGPAG